MSKTLQELQKEKAALDSQIANQLRRERDAEAARVRGATAEYERVEGVHVGISDDYATLTVGRHGPSYRTETPDRSIEFYYGYERATEEGEWCFTVEERGVETLRLRASELHPKIEEGEPLDALLCGIGMWIGRRLPLTGEE